jgi:hypothetical protein
MRKLYVFLLLPLSLIFIQGCGDEQGLKEEDLGEFNKITWIEGIWEGRDGDADFYESWRSRSYRSLEGISYTTIRDERVYEQTMRIEQSNNKITLTINFKEGAEQTVLDLMQIAEGRVVFVKTSGTYPEKVVYSKEGDNRMKVQLSGTQNADAGVQEFEYKKTGDT